MIVQVDSTQRYTGDGAKLCAISVLLPQHYKKTMKRLTGEHTNNFAELAAILDALTMLAGSKEDADIVIETDSQVSWGWIVKNWKVHDTTQENDTIKIMIGRCQELLSSNKNIRIKKINRKYNQSDLSRVDTEDLEKLEEYTV